MAQQPEPCGRSTLTAATRERVDRFWGDVFGLDGPDEAPVITAHRGALSGYDGVYVVVRHGSVLVSAPETVRDRIAARPPADDEASDPRWWTRRLPGWEVVGPSVHAFVDAPPPLPGESRAVEVHLADLASLRAEVSTKDWVESGFDDAPAAVWAGRDGTGRVVAAANLTLFDGRACDVGVLTSPSVRGAGWGETVARAAVHQAVVQHGLARWRSRVANVPSRRLARRLGFKDDCLQLAARPPGGH